MDKNIANHNGLYKESFLTKALRIPEIGILIPLIIVIIIFSLIKPAFFSLLSFMSIARSMSYYGIIAIGMAYCLITGQIDLSVGSVAGLTAIISGIFIVRIGLPIWLSLILGLLIAAFIGLVNGYISVKLRIPSIIVTLGMLFAISGIAFRISRGHSIYPLPESLVKFGAAQPLGISWSFIIFIILVIIFDFFLRKTIFGRKIYSTGANDVVAKINGINTDIVKISTHILVSFLAGLSGVLFMFRILAADIKIGSGWEFVVIAGVIIGGVSILGGSGTIWGVFMGVMFMGIVKNGLVFMGIKSQWQDIAVGLIMIITSGFDIWRRTRKHSSI
ncbi:MAG: ABC transporter permease [Actinobacteria bacterium]|nr:ABC transporter permease [Actinomycetota bacterium]